MASIVLFFSPSHVIILGRRCLFRAFRIVSLISVIFRAFFEHESLSRSFRFVCCEKKSRDEFRKKNNFSRDVFILFRRTNGEKKGDFYFISKNFSIRSRWTYTKARDKKQSMLWQGEEKGKWTFPISIGNKLHPFRNFWPVEKMTIKKTIRIKFKDVIKPELIFSRSLKCINLYWKKREKKAGKFSNSFNSVYCRKINAARKKDSDDENSRRKRDGLGFFHDYDFSNHCNDGISTLRG